MSKQQPSIDIASSSSSSRDSSVRERMNNAKHFTENVRLNEVLNLYSTLQEDDNDDEDSLAGVGQIKGHIATAVASQGENQQPSLFAPQNSSISSNGSFGGISNETSNFIGRIQNMIKKRLFQANYVLLDNNYVTPWIFQIMTVIEFLQFLFFIFYKVDIVNEYTPLIITGGPVVDEFSKTNQTQNVTQDEQTSERTITIQTFQLETFLKYINFPIAILENQSLTDFNNLYEVLCITFLIFIFVTFGFANRFFKDTRSGDIKEGTRILNKALSMVLASFLFVLQIPMLTIFFQGFMCNEDADDIYILPTECGTTQNFIMIGVSTVGLILYIGFIMIERLLYTSRCYENEVPWASLEKKFDFLKLLLKVILTASFIFDKIGKSSGLIKLLCSFLCIIIIYNRIARAQIINETVHYVILFQESLMTWLFITIGSQQIGTEEVSVTTLSLILISGIFMSCLVLYFQMKLKTELILIENPMNKLKTPEKFELYYFRLFQLIEKPEDPSSRMLLSSVLINHLEDCVVMDTQCQQCLECASHIDGLAKITGYRNNLRNHHHQSQEYLSQLYGPTSRGEKTQSLSNGEKLVQTPRSAGEPSLAMQNSTCKVVITKRARHPSVLYGSNINVEQDPNISYAHDVIRMAESTSAMNLSDGVGQFLEPQSVSSNNRKVPIKLKSGQAQIKIAPSLFFKSNPSNTTHAQTKVNPHSTKDTHIFNDKFTISSKKTKIEAMGPEDHTLIDDIQSQFTKYEHKNISALNDSSSAIIKRDDQIIKVTDGGEYMDFEIDEDLEEQYMNVKPEKFQKYWYQFLSFQIKDAILRHPRNVELKLISSFIQRSKLQNEFKSIFELMNCEQCDPDLFSKFTIFRRKILIQQQLIVSNEKNASPLGNLDVKTVYVYEKLFQQYSLFEYVTANAALGFWRELLSKNINAQAIQSRGAEISRNYIKIQEVSRALMKIYPNDIKLLYRLGLFLKQIVNNEYEALTIFEKAIEIYQAKAAKKSASAPVNEQTIFGENTASAIIIISSTSSSVGNILHANCEVQHILGYQPIELMSRNISIIMPVTLGDNHDSFINKYFETGKSKMMNQKNQIFGVTKDGYLRHLTLLMKVYPHLQDKIIFVGFMQKSDSFEAMQFPKTEFEHAEFQYIMTDQKGSITNVTEGLYKDLGLNSKFLMNFTSINYSLNISIICPDILDDEIQESIECGEGQIITFDTRELLNFVEIEQLTSEEILEVRSNLGIYQGYVQLKRMTYNETSICIYRILLLQEDDLNMNSYHQKMISSKLSNGDLMIPVRSGDGQLGVVAKQIGSMFQSSVGNQQSGESVSAASGNESFSSISGAGGHSGVSNFFRMIRDFKKALGERKTPKNLIYLNQIIIVMFSIQLILAIVDYFMKQELFSQLNHDCTHLFQTQRRSIELILLVTNIRTYINVANNLEPNFYEGVNLYKIDRLSYLAHLIEASSEELQDVHDYLSKQRDVVASDTQEELEDDLIPLFQLDQNKKIYKHSLPYRIAFNQYLNVVQFLNSTNSPSDIILPKGSSLIRGAPDKYLTFENTDENQKNAVFLILNGLRSVREKSMEITEHQNGYAFSSTMNSTFLAIMIVGILVSTLSITIVLHQIWVTERNKADILSLYALLRMNQIKQVYDKSDKYLDALVTNGGMQFNMEETQNDLEQEKKATISAQPFGNYFNSTVQNAKQQRDNAGNRQSQQHIDEQDEDLSEEEKEELAFTDFMSKKKLKRNKEQLSRNLAKKRGSLGQDYYHLMVKEVNHHIKEIQNKGASTTVKLQRRMSVVPGGKTSTDRALIEDLGSIVRKRGSQRGRKDSIDSGEDSHSEEQHSSQSKDDMSPHQSKRSRRKTLSRAAEQKQKEQDDRAQSEFELKNEEMQMRKRNFFKSVNAKNWKFLSMNAFFGFMFTAYFIYGYSYHLTQVQNLKIFHDNSPSFYNRYSDMILAYAFARERIINNNSLSTFESTSPFSPVNADDFFKQQSLKDEAMLTQLKAQKSNILSPMIELLKTKDSKNFCMVIIGQFQGGVEEKTVSSRNYDKKLKEIRKKAYQVQIQTVIAACNAASENHLSNLMRLGASGVDLNQGDYDKRTPLHVSCGAGNIEIVRYLLDEAKVNISPVDRWGATPLNDAQPFPEIKQLLLLHGGVIGKPQPPYVGVSVTVTDDQFRLYYAAFYGDVAMMDNLRLLGWNVNGQDYDGRTALGIASSEGHIDVVKYLVSKGADLSIKDARGNDPLSDAKRESRASVIEYLNSIINDSLIRSYCSDFEDGLLSKGIQQAFGIFHKRLADLQININKTTSYPYLLSLLSPATNSSNEQSVQKTLRIFINTHELYLHKVIRKMATVVNLAQQSQVDTYSQTTEYIFILFLLFQVAVMYLRTKLIHIMREDIFQSRGILNLIPEELFEENRESVENLIKKLKD